MERQSFSSLFYLLVLLALISGQCNKCEQLAATFILEPEDSIVELTGLSSNTGPTLPVTNLLNSRPATIETVPGTLDSISFGSDEVFGGELDDASSSRIITDDSPALAPIQQPITRPPKPANHLVSQLEPLLNLQQPEVVTSYRRLEEESQQPPQVNNKPHQAQSHQQQPPPPQPHSQPSQNHQVTRAPAPMQGPVNQPPARPKPSQAPASSITSSSSTSSTSTNDGDTSTPKTEDRLLISITNDDDDYKPARKPLGSGLLGGALSMLDAAGNNPKRKPSITISIADPLLKPNGQGQPSVIVRPSENGEGIVISTLGNGQTPPTNQLLSGGGGGVPVQPHQGLHQGQNSAHRPIHGPGPIHGDHEHPRPPINNLDNRPINNLDNRPVNNLNNRPITSTLIDTPSRPNQFENDQRPQQPSRPIYPSQLEPNRPSSSGEERPQRPSLIADESNFDQNQPNQQPPVQRPPINRPPINRPVNQPNGGIDDRNPDAFGPNGGGRPIINNNNVNNVNPQQALEPKFPLNEKNCGLMQETRIVGGEEANPDDFLWMAAIVKSRPVNGEARPFCGGSLITRRHIMTAAHCLEGLAPRDVLVRLGSYDFDDATASSLSADYAIDQFRVPASYSKKTHVADIAIMRLKTPLSLNDNYKTVCMPQARRSYVGALGTVTGYGSQSQTFRRAAPKLRQVTVPVWENRKCAVVYKKNLTESFLCAGYEEGGKDACQGDSGGPLMTEGPNERMMVIGVVSHGIGCGSPGYPGVYTRTTTFLDWIEKNTRE